MPQWNQAESLVPVVFIEERGDGHWPWVIFPNAPCVFAFVGTSSSSPAP
jgi:hypothetical protein